MLKSAFIGFIGHHFTTPSCTVPNMSLSISEMLARYEVGRDVPVMPRANYDLSNSGYEDTTLRDPQDLVDLDSSVSTLFDKFNNLSNDKDSDINGSEETLKNSDSDVSQDSPNGDDLPKS